MTCPTCGANARIVFDDQCAECADGETAAWIERLQPEGG